MIIKMYLKLHKKLSYNPSNYICAIFAIFMQKSHAMSYYFMTTYTVLHATILVNALLINVKFLD